MISATGNTMQEDKINRLATAVCSSSTKAGMLNTKGALRFGIAGALKQHSYERWEDVAKQGRAERKRFFESVLRHALPHLRNMGMDQEELARASRPCGKRTSGS